MCNFFKSDKYCETDEVSYLILNGDEKLNHILISDTGISAMSLSNGEIFSFFN